MSLSEARNLFRKLWSANGAMLLLLLGHLPFVVFYYQGLWRHQPHYQFFPFALGAFVWLFATRKDPAPESWGPLPRLLVAIDLLLLPLGILGYFPWVVAAGMCCLLLAWCWASTEIGFQRRLTYLALLPLLTLRLPSNGDQDVILLLQGVTTTVASRTLQRFGFLHVQLGNMLDFPGKRFMVEEACSGVQSLFTILFIAALVICVKRRTLAHGAVLLLSGIAFAGIMNVLRVTSIAIAWERFDVDLSTGYRHDILGYICLSVAGILLMSADSFLSFITDPVPDVRRPGPVGAFRNPLIAVWNWLFGVVQLPIPLPGTGAEAVSTRRSWRWTQLAAGACVLLLTAQAWALRGTPTQNRTRNAAEAGSLREIQLPDTIAGFTKDSQTAEPEDSATAGSRQTHSWTFSAGDIHAQVKCVYPCFEWQPAELNMASDGWHAYQSEVTGTGGPHSVVVPLSQSDSGQHGLLIYSYVDSQGQLVDPPGMSSRSEQLVSRLLSGVGRGDEARVLYRLEVFLKSAVMPDAGIRSSLLDLHQQIRAQLMQQLERP